MAAQIVLFVMVLFICSILAQDLLQDVKYNRSITPQGVNFKNFFNSMFSLFKIVTGEGWLNNAIDATRP